MTLICSRPIIDGVQLPSLTFSRHAVERAHESKVSLLHLFRLLRKGKFLLVNKVDNQTSIVRFEQIDLVIDTAINLIKSVVITTVRRIYVKPPKIGDLISAESREKLERELVIKRSTFHRHDYISNFLQLNAIKKLTRRN